MDNAVSCQMELFPPTRYMGSKRKIVPSIYDVSTQLEFNTALDLFSGSGVVSYLFKAMGKSVTSNDYMAMAATVAKAVVGNSSITLDEAIVQKLLAPCETDEFVERTFRGLYYTDDENRFIDRIRNNLTQLADEQTRSMAMAALIRACVKKRPRGIFTYTGFRYDDGRRDLRLSFQDQFLEAVAAYNGAVFDNGMACRAVWGDAFSPELGRDYDLVYLDPPYYTPLSDNEYVRRYHFVEGLARNWKGVEIQQHTKTKKFKSYPTPFSTEQGACRAFDGLFDRYRKSILIVSYSSNGLPSKEDMTALLKNAGKVVEVIPVKHKYSFGNSSTASTRKNEVEEFLFVAV